VTIEEDSRLRLYELALDKIEESCRAVQEEYVKAHRPDGGSAAWAILMSVRFTRRVMKGK
jgi:hypothetical protein